MRMKIKQIKHPKTGQPSPVGTTVTMKGWVRTVRNQKSFAFIEINDGSTLSNLQVVANPDIPNYQKILDQLSTGSSVVITGIIAPRKGFFLTLFLGNYIR